MCYHVLLWYLKMEVTIGIFSLKITKYYQAKKNNIIICISLTEIFALVCWHQHAQNNAWLNEHPQLNQEQGLPGWSYWQCKCNYHNIVVYEELGCKNTFIHFLPKLSLTHRNMQFQKLHFYNITQIDTTMTTMRNNGMIRWKKFHSRTRSNELKHAKKSIEFHAQIVSICQKNGYENHGGSLGFETRTSRKHTNQHHDTVCQGSDLVPVWMFAKLKKCSYIAL